MARALDSIARMDGYSVRLATDKRQEQAWRGTYGVFRGNALQFAAGRPDRVRAWLYDRAKCEGMGTNPIATAAY